MPKKTACNKPNIIVKRVSGKIISESNNTNKAYWITGAEASHAPRNFSAILVVESKNERMRTIREYEKQRDIVRNTILSCCSKERFG